MTEVTIRRMPITDDNARRVIVQVPLDGKEQVFQLPELLLRATYNEQIEWITPIQVSQQYSGVPAPGFTFIVRPPSYGDRSTQWLDVFYNLQLVQSFAFGGPHGRIVQSAPYEQSGDGVKDLMVLASTVAFLVQVKKIPDEATENSNPAELQHP